MNPTDKFDQTGIIYPHFFAPISLTNLNSPNLVLRLKNYHAHEDFERQDNGSAERLKNYSAI